MGALIDVESSSFILPAHRFGDALAAVQALARDSPSEFRDADAVLAAPDLPSALDAESWAVNRDDSGLTAIRYAADKPPWDSEPDWPTSIVEALAPFVTAGKLRVQLDGEEILAFTISNGTLTTD